MGLSNWRMPNASGACDRPPAYWDDHMRLQTVRAGRQCIRPEVCRTYNFGAVGSSAGQHFNMYLRPIRLNNVTVPWTATVRKQA